MKKKQKTPIRQYKRRIEGRAVSKNLEKNYHRILKRINTPHCDLRDTAEEILDFMVNVFGADRAEITIFRENFDINIMELTEDAAVKLRLSRGYSEEQWQTLESSGILLQTARYVLDSKKSSIVSDTREEPPEAQKLSEYLEHGSWMNYVLVVEGKVMANIHLVKKEHNYYKPRDLKRLEYLSMLLATVINLSHMWERERRLMINFIQSLNKALEVRDEYTAGHVERVMFYSSALARKVGMNAREIESVETAAILHDIGKIGVGDNVLKKPGGLSWEEKELIRKHVPLTDEIFENLHHMDEARIIARYHHETLDGKGYMYGLKDDEIPVGSKILAIADAFDAMTSDRPYRKAFFVEEAMAILEDPAITQWDKKIVKVFDEYLHSDEFLKKAEERGMVKYSDEQKLFYDIDSSILRFRDLIEFFKDTSLDVRLKKKQKINLKKITVSELQKIGVKEG